MKLSTLCFGALLGSLLLDSCHSSPDKDTVQPAPKPVLFTVIKADSTDLLPQYSTEQDNRLDGELRFEASYFVREGDYRFTLADNYFLASYAGTPLYNNRVNGVLMCMDSYNNCDSTRLRGASLWDLHGNLSGTPQLIWQYVNQQQDQGYRLVMTDLPKPIRLESLPTVLSTKADNIVLFHRDDAQDSVRFELISLSKAEITQAHTIPFITYARFWFPIAIKADRLVLPGKELKKTLDYFQSPMASDTVFINVASVRKVIKVVDGKKMQLTYQINRLTPITIQ